MGTRAEICEHHARNQSNACFWSEAEPYRPRFGRFWPNWVTPGQSSPKLVEIKPRVARSGQLANMCRTRSTTSQNETQFCKEWSSSFHHGAKHRPTLACIGRTCTMGPQFAPEAGTGPELEMCHFCPSCVDAPKGRLDNIASLGGQNWRASTATAGSRGAVGWAATSRLCPPRSNSSVATWPHNHREPWQPSPRAPQPELSARHVHRTKFTKSGTRSPFVDRKRLSGRASLQPKHGPPSADLGQSRSHCNGAPRRTRLHHSQAISAAGRSELEEAQQSRRQGWSTPPRKRT